MKLTREMQIEVELEEIFRRDPRAAQRWPELLVERWGQADEEIPQASTRAD